MLEKDWMSTKAAAEYLGVTKPQIFRLIKEGKLNAVLDKSVPIPYYQVDTESVTKYKNSPKNKGGRPPQKG